MLNKYQLWLFRKFLAKMLKQGRHEQGIKKVFTELIVVYNEEFPEDNLPTRDAYLKELLDERLKTIKGLQQK